jgi:hypothetical protein
MLERKGRESVRRMRGVRGVRRKDFLYFSHFPHSSYFPTPHTPSTSRSLHLPTSLPLATQNHENIFNESGELGHLFGISEEVLKLGDHYYGKSRYYSRFTCS